MTQDFETLPIGTEAALRDMVNAECCFDGSFLDYHAEEFARAKAILAQIDAQRKGATDGK